MEVLPDFKGPRVKIVSFVAICDLLGICWEKPDNVRGDRESHLDWIIHTSAYGHSFP